MSEVTIRHATQDDADALVPLVRAYRAFYEQQPDAQRERAFIGEHLRNHTSVICIAQLNGAAAGFMQLFKTYSTVHLCASWILEDLFVDPAHRHAGAGTALLRHALQHVREDGAAGMCLKRRTIIARRRRSTKRPMGSRGWLPPLQRPAA